MKSKQKIINLLKNRKELQSGEIADETGFSRQYIHRVLNELLEENIVIKVGRPPLTYYKCSEPEIIKASVHIPKEQQLFLQQHFLWISEKGEKLEGKEAMEVWCKRQKLPFEKTVDEYINTRKKYLKFYNNEIYIDGTQKLINTVGFEKIGIDKMMYLDFYAIERFGKTRLGTLMHYAKQGQNKTLMAQIVEETKDTIHQIVKEIKPDAILFVPPTIKREIQIMHYLKKHLAVNKIEIDVQKVKSEIVIPQKALSKINERIANTQMSFLVREKIHYKKILLIDDAIGSGATMNEIANKIKDKGITKQVLGLAITGSYKGFEVISEL
ncbi:MAG: HTH domain-containing protein [Sphingobacteriales bacterium]|jgi:hypoxanthine-guanine phosphoribosyltransferase|nr:HTH domain-containing protein [Sphingobacteriales bacterium]